MIGSIWIPQVAIRIEDRTMKTLLVITAVASLLVGCATSSVRRTEQWEYKVAAPPFRGFNQANPASNLEDRRKTSEAFLNDIGKEGWIFIEKDESGWYYFKRAKR
jgi:hypothetical protein